MTNEKCSVVTTERCLVVVDGKLCGSAYRCAPCGKPAEGRLKNGKPACGACLRNEKLGGKDAD
jgi:hypothetical protein